MTVANLENCKRLWELSGWNQLDGKWWVEDKYPNLPMGIFVGDRAAEKSNFSNIAPAYNLGFMLRKLPCPESGELVIFKWRYVYTAVYQAAYGEKRVRIRGDTPEDATAKLCIALFEQGILNHE